MGAGCQGGESGGPASRGAERETEWELDPGPLKYAYWDPKDEP